MTVAEEAQYAADLLEPPVATSRWYCDRDGCDGEPHPGWHWCEHPIVGHPTGDQYWRCRHARTNQHPPVESWRYWMIMAGRGWGKTRTGAEWLVHQTKLNPGCWWLVMAPNRDDVKATCIEGESGLLAALGIHRDDPCYNKSDLTIRLPNGSVIRGLSAERPDRARGPNLSGVWLDEVGAWRYHEAWETLEPAMRRSNAQVVVTTTPRRTRLVKELIDRAGTNITTGATRDNAANLSGAALDDLYARWEGTRHGQQELEGLLLTDVPGALWTWDGIEAARIMDDRQIPDMERIVVGVDPAVTSSETSDETGIVIAGKHAGQFYILADYSLRATPHEWANRAIAGYQHFTADLIVGEMNNGGDLIETTLRTIAPNVAYLKVHASRGKQIRAEPVAALYEQHRVHHCGHFAELEDQMTIWDPTDSRAKSPDRVDALVWAVTTLAEPSARSVF